MTHFQESLVDTSGHPVADFAGETGVETWPESDVGDHGPGILVEDAEDFDENGGEFSPGDLGVAGALQSLRQVPHW